jgi:hypothetical protein
MRVIARGQTASAEDLSYVLNKLNDLYDYLTHVKKLINNNNYYNINQIPSFAVDAYEIMLMSRCSDRYGRPTSTDEFNEGLRLLRQVTAAPAKDELQEALYY